jgi:hypothetical protein
MNRAVKSTGEGKFRTTKGREGPALDGLGVQRHVLTALPSGKRSGSNCTGE